MTKKVITSSTVPFFPADNKTGSSVMARVLTSAFLLRFSRSLAHAACPSLRFRLACESCSALWAACSRIWWSSAWFWLCSAPSSLRSRLNASAPRSLFSRRSWRTRNSSRQRLASTWNEGKEEPSFLNQEDRTNRWEAPGSTFSLIVKNTSLQSPVNSFSRPLHPSFSPSAFSPSLSSCTQMFTFTQYFCWTVISAVSSLLFCLLEPSFVLNFIRFKEKKKIKRYMKV